MQQTLAKAIAITAAQAAAEVPGSRLQLLDGARSLALQAAFTYGSGGATVDAYIQTSLDGGTTWFDIANFHFTTASAVAVFNLSSLTPVTAQYTPGSAALAANTVKDGLLGDRFRVLQGSTGTYAGTTLTIAVVAQER